MSFAFAGLSYLFAGHLNNGGHCLSFQTESESKWNRLVDYTKSKDYHLEENGLCQGELVK